MRCSWADFCRAPAATARIKVQSDAACADMCAVRVRDMIYHRAAKKQLIGDGLGHRYAGRANAQQVEIISPARAIWPAANRAEACLDLVVSVDGERKNAHCWRACDDS